VVGEELGVEDGLEDGVGVGSAMNVADCGSSKSVATPLIGTDALTTTLPGDCPVKLNVMVPEALVVCDTGLNCIPPADEKVTGTSATGLQYWSMITAVNSAASLTLTVGEATSKREPGIGPPLASSQTNGPGLTGPALNGTGR